jgi:ethanolamine phosphate transferase 2 subunit G
VIALYNVEYCTLRATDAMSPFTTKVALLVANVLIPCAIFIFASGFFPYKPFLPGLAESNELQDGSRSPPPFDKVVFMVVDALRRCVGRVE